MKVLFLFLALAAAVCDVHRIVQCAKTHLDANHDDAITKTEIDQFILNNNCGALQSGFNGMDVLSRCDLNGDGLLTEAQDALTTRGCLYTSVLREHICKACDYCDSMIGK